MDFQSMGPQSDTAPNHKLHYSEGGPTAFMTPLFPPLLFLDGMFTETCHSVSMMKGEPVRARKKGALRVLSPALRSGFPHPSPHHSHSDRCQGTRTSQTARLGRR